MRRAFLAAMLAYAVPTFVLGYVWHLQLFHARYEALGIYRPDVIIPFGFAAILIQGAVLAAAWVRLVDRPSDLADGMRFAAVAALVAWTFTTLAVAAKHPMSSVSGYVVIETAFTIAQYLIVGPLLVLSSRPASARLRHA